MGVYNKSRCCLPGRDCSLPALQGPLELKKRNRMNGAAKLQPPTKPESQLPSPAYRLNTASFS